MARGVILDGLDLQAGYFTITETDAFNAPPKSVNVLELARKAGAKTVFEKFGARKINLTGYIQADSIDNADGALDQLKSYVNRRGLQFKLEYRGEYRIWGVNVENLQTARKGTDVSRMGFNLGLVAPNPFASDEYETELVNEEGVTSSINIPLVAGGSYYAMPLIQITINSIDPDDDFVSLSIGNAIENTYMSITGIFVAGDVITIDSFNEIIYKNNEIIEGDGIFPVWSPTGGTFEYTDDATSRDIDILATYYRRWL